MTSVLQFRINGKHEKKVKSLHLSALKPLLFCFPSSWTFVFSSMSITTMCSRPQSWCSRFQNRVIDPLDDGWCSGATGAENKRWPDCRPRMFPMLLSFIFYLWCTCSQTILLKHKQSSKRCSECILKSSTESCDEKISARKSRTLWAEL